MSKNIFDIHKFLSENSNSDIVEYVGYKDENFDIADYVKTNSPNISVGPTKYEDELEFDSWETDPDHITTRVYYMGDTPVGWYDEEQQMGFLIDPPIKEEEMNELQALQSLSGIKVQDAPEKPSTVPATVSISATASDMNSIGNVLKMLLKQESNNTTITDDSHCEKCTDSVDVVADESVTDSGEIRKDNREFSNSPHEQERKYDPNDFTNVVNKVRDLDASISPRLGDNPIKKEEVETSIPSISELSNLSEEMAVLNALMSDFAAFKAQK